MTALILVLLAQPYVTPSVPQTRLPDGGWAVRVWTDGTTSGGGSSSVVGVIYTTKLLEAYYADASVTAQAFEANPADCSPGQYAEAIAANGNLTCSTPAAGGGGGYDGGKVGEAFMADASITSQTTTAFATNPSDCAAGNYAIAIDAQGNLTCVPVPTFDGGQVAAAFSADASVTAQAFAANPADCAVDEYAIGIQANGDLICLALPPYPPTYDGGKVAEAFAADASITSQTATALAADPTDCSAGQYATTIAASGNLTCAQVAYSQVSGTPTIPTAATIGKVAEAYAADASVFAQQFVANPTDCPGGEFANAIDSSGNLSCAVPSGGGKVAEAFAADASITSQTTTAFATNPTDCGGGQFANAIDSQGNLSCATPAGGSTPDSGVWRIYIITDGGTRVETNDGGVNTVLLSVATTATYSYEMNCQLWSTNDGGAAQGARYRLNWPTAQAGFSAAEVCAGSTNAKQITESNATPHNVLTAASANTTRCKDRLILSILDAGAGTIDVRLFPETAAGTGGFAAVWDPSYCDVLVKPTR